MSKLETSAKQIASKLREADSELSKGTHVNRVWRQLNITNKTF